MTGDGLMQQTIDGRSREVKVNSAIAIAVEWTPRNKLQDESCRPKTQWANESTPKARGQIPEV